MAAEGSVVRATWRGDLTSGEASYAAADMAAPLVFIDGILLRGDDYRVALQSEDPEMPVDATLLVYRLE